MRGLWLAIGGLACVGLAFAAGSSEEGGRFPHDEGACRVTRQGDRFILSPVEEQGGTAPVAATTSAKVSSAQRFLWSARGRLGLDLATDSFELDSLCLAAPSPRVLSFYPTYHGAELLGGRADVRFDAAGHLTSATVMLAPRRIVPVSRLAHADALSIARGAVRGTWSGRVLVNGPIIDSLESSGFRCYQRVVMGVVRAGAPGTAIVYIDPVNRKVVSVGSADKY